MQKFTYKAKNNTGETLIGEIESTSENSAARVLITKKLFPIEIKNITARTENPLEKIPFLSFLDGISKKKKAVAMRQLSALINAGLSLTQSLLTMSKESGNQKLKNVFNDVLRDVEGGTSLTQAFSSHPRAFSPLDISLINAGERSGTLDKVLKRLANQLEKEAELISKLRGAMIYPAFVLIAVVGVIALMLLYVVPKLTELYQDFKGNIPAVTQFLINLSNFSKSYWWAIILIIVVTAAGFKSFINTEIGRKYWDFFKIKAPIFNVLIVKIYLARFTRTLGTLIGAGVPVLDSLRITSDSVGNVVYKQALLDATEKVKSGTALSTPLADSSLFPAIVSQMIKVGEQTGDIDGMLDSLANYYEDEVDNLTKGLATLIEPLIVVLLGFIVAFIVIAVMSPIYSLSKTIFDAPRM